MDDNRCCRFPSSYPPCLRVRYHPLSTIPLLRLDLVASDYTLLGRGGSSSQRQQQQLAAARSSSQQLAAARSSSPQLAATAALAALAALAAAAAARSSSGSGSGGRGHILAFRSSGGRTHCGTWSWAASSVWRARAASDSSSGGLCASRGATGPPHALACAAF
jgi:hypothetical protein